MKDNQSDNDLIISEIGKIIGSGKITSILQEDIHGFGIPSIIVTIGNEENLSQDIQNKFIILDSVQNKILNNKNDLLGLKSPFKVTFEYTLYDKIRNETVDLHPQIESIIDIIGETDLAKEIIVKYGFHGVKPAANVNYVAVFRYSYEKAKYELIGTYPQCEKLNLTTYVKDGNKETYTRDDQMVYTDFKKSKSDNNFLFFDEDKQFHLTEMSSSIYRDFWLETQRVGKVLVIAKLDLDNWRALVNCYCPIFDENSYELSWRAIFSEEITISTSECEDEIYEELSKALGGSIKWIE